MNLIEGLPKDVVKKAAITTVTGNSEICIENYRGILEYRDTLVRIQTKTGQIRIRGAKLTVAYYTNDEMQITGNIASVEYC